MAGHKKRRVPVFRILYVVFLWTLVLFWAAVLNYVQRSLTAYEAAQPERVMEALALKIEEGGGEEAIPVSSGSNRFEDGDLQKNRYLEALSGKEITFEKAPGSYDMQQPVYHLYADGKKIASVTLRETASETVMLILSVQEWETASVEPVLEAEEKGYLIYVPNNCTVMMNQIAADERELTGNKRDIEEFEYAAEYISVPYIVEYRIEGLLDVPEIAIFDCFGQEVEYTIEGDVVEYAGLPTSEMEEELKAFVLKNAENYSDFFSGDLAGGDKSVEPLRYMFPKDSSFLELAENYRRNDLWMYSMHQTPVFANEKVSNYVRYSEDFFSCDVYFEKNMLLTKTGQVRTVVTNDKYYYVKLDGSWVIADMRTVIGE